MTLDSHSPWEHGLFNQRSPLLFKEQVLVLAAKINFGWVRHGWKSGKEQCKTADFICFINIYQCLQATLLPSYSWISCQVSQNVRLGQETNLLLTCQTCLRFPLISCKVLVSVYSPSNPGASKPNNPSSNKLITVKHRDIFQGICGICIFLICTILDLGRSKNQWQGAQETEPTVCGTAELPAMPSFRDLRELCPWPAWQPALEGTSQAESWHHTSDAAIEHFFEDLEVWSSLIPRYL